MSWDNIEVVWLQDERFPVYNLVFYFADGALSDKRKRYGETDLMFDMLSSGTRRFSQREISDNLEFYGSDFSTHVTHEYSLFEVSGLVKDIVPTLKQICHLFRDATFPKRELVKEKRQRRNRLKNLITSHGSLADRAFRELSMKFSPFSKPVSGKLSSLKMIKQKHLKDKLDYFNKSVKKRIYITGPKSSLISKEIINEECRWSGGENNFVRKQAFKSKTNRGVFLITVPKANQTQLRIGKVLSKNEITRPELLLFSSNFLGGGFTSLLMKAVRVEAGLSYGVGAFAAGQKEYGRSGISTFTKNKQINQLLSVVKNTLKNVHMNRFKNDDFERSKGYLIGSYPFSFEKSSDFLRQLISLDHKEIDYKYFYDLPNIIKKITREEVSKSSKNLFLWKDQTIVIVGPKSLYKRLKKIGKIKVIPYQKFL